MKVLIVEDDARVSSFLERGLKAEGYRPQVAHNASTGISMAKALQKEVRENFESAVVILDVMLPDGSGLDVCQTLRAEGFALPVLMLTALNSVEDRVAGLRMGADDYLGKPFAFDEILARLEALGRRVGSAAPKQARKNLEVADLNLDLVTFLKGMNHILKSEINSRFLVRNQSFSLFSRISESCRHDLTSYHLVVVSVDNPVFLFCRFEIFRIYIN